jgi:carboxypeptidase PM20D1
MLENFGGSLMLVWHGSDPTAEPIMLMNHHDVVPAPGAWRYPPFSATVADGRLYGRGTLDTKSGLFAMLEAAEELIASGFVPSRDVYFVSSCNEETTGAGADLISSTLAERGLRFAFVLDEGGMILTEPMGGAKGDFAVVGVGEKGDADLRFVARSSGGHASTPGKNTPLVRLGKFMAAVEKKKLFKAKLSPTVCATLRELSKAMRGPMRLLLGHPRLFSPLLRRVMPAVSGAAGAMLKTTLAFTMASGSDAANVLPNEAWVVGNMRYSHHQGREASIEAVRRLAKRYGVETEILQSGFPSPVTDYRSAGFALLEKAVERVFPGVRTAPYIMTAASDARYMSRISDCTLRFTPFHVSDEQLDAIHGIDESIDVSALAPAVDFYQFILKEA